MKPEKQELYEVKIEEIFEGPMDLLVFLVKKHEIDIYDIPIGMITEQFLNYIEWMKNLNIDLAGEFLMMASTLTHIKSKMMLPVHDDEEDAEDPRDQIAQPLAEYIKMKSAAEQLANRDILGETTFSRGKYREDFFSAPEDEEYIKVGLFELIDAFQRILDNIAPEEKLNFSSDRISIKGRISEIVDILEEKRTVTFEELFTETVNKTELVITFLAILEMVKLSLIRIAQHVQSGIIRIIYQ